MKKTIYNKVVGIVFLAILFSHVAYAQNERNKALIYSYLHGWEYSIKAGLSIGGTSPLPLPKEIRSIDSYAPNIAIAIEGNTTKWFGKDKKWGMTAGIRLENKTMTTEATVKNYGMKIINTNGGELHTVIPDTSSDFVFRNVISRLSCGRGMVSPDIMPLPESDMFRVGSAVLGLPATNVP